MTARAAVILAAGQGTRMRSALPKVLHQVGGRPMVDWSVALAHAVGCERIIVVCSPSGQAVQDGRYSPKLPPESRLQKCKQEQPHRSPVQ